MDKLRKYRKKLIIALTALLVVMLSISIVYGKYTSSRVSVVDLTVKHTVEITYDKNLPSDASEDAKNEVIIQDKAFAVGKDGKTVYPTLPQDTFSADNAGLLPGYYLEGWYLDQACTDGQEVKAGQDITVEKAGNLATKVTLYAKWKKAQEIGGDIFYIDPDVYGALYKFYKEDKTEITDWNKGAGHETDTLTALEDAKYYLKVGSNSNTTGDAAKDYKTDKFYVVASEEGATTVLDSGAWGDATADSVEDGIGKGKSNTRALMESVKTTGGTPGTVTYPDGTIWKALGDFIKGDTMHADWYICSKAEMDMYREWSGCNETILSENNLWTSTMTKYTEPTNHSKVSFWNLDKWNEITPTNEKFNVIPMRSF